MLTYIATELFEPDMISKTISGSMVSLQSGAEKITVAQVTNENSAETQFLGQYLRPCRSR